MFTEMKYLLLDLVLCFLSSELCSFPHMDIVHIFRFISKVFRGLWVNDDILNFNGFIAGIEGRDWYLRVNLVFIHQFFFDFLHRRLCHLPISIHLSIYLPTYLCLSACLYLSLYLSTYLYRSAYLPIYFYLPIYLSVCQPTHLSIVIWFLFLFLLSLLGLLVWCWVFWDYVFTLFLVSAESNFLVIEDHIGCMFLEMVFIKSRYFLYIPSCRKAHYECWIL